MRHDALIIWGHGLPDLDRVLDLVRATPGFKIRRILLRDIEDMPRFVRSVYNFDYAPYRHLIDKTRYLLSVPPRAAFIFIDNFNPQEHTVGKGRFAHTECAKMTALKRAIREQFNPRDNGQPSEHHIVHGTDHAGQTIATLKLIGFRGIDELVSETSGILDTPDHLPPQKQWTLKQIDLSKVYARIATPPGRDTKHDVMPIGQTPHALHLAGDPEAYETYWQTHRGTRLQEDHAPQAFTKLNEQLDYLGPGHPDSYLLLDPMDDERYVLLDGAHRAAILLSQGVKQVVAAVANEQLAGRSDGPSQTPDLMELFESTASHDYAVIKTIPEAQPEMGSDIDILCADKAALAKQFLRNCRSLVEQGYAVRLRELPETDQTHMDIMRGGMISLRLDLHEGLGAYQHVPIKETYAQRLLARRTWSDVTCPTGVLRLAVPDAVDNLVMRYLEYHEWFDRRPDKIKHADHIAQAIVAEPAQAKAFYDRLMQATSQRPTGPALRYCDLNLKRQCVWAFWSLRDKLAWRIASVRNIAVMAVTQPGVFAGKLLNRLGLQRTAAHKAQQNPQ